MRLCYCLTELGENILHLEIAWYMLKLHGQNYCAAQKTIFDSLQEKPGNPGSTEIQRGMCHITTTQRYEFPQFIEYLPIDLFIIKLVLDSCSQILL